MNKKERKRIAMKRIGKQWSWGITEKVRDTGGRRC
jgi:hypothetical protein